MCAVLYTCAFANWMWGEKEGFFGVSRCRLTGRFIGGGFFEGGHCGSSVIDDGKWLIVGKDCAMRADSIFVVCEEIFMMVMGFIYEIKWINIIRSKNS